MNIQSLEWDDENIGHIAEHNVSPKEAQDVIYGFHFSRRESKNKYILSGQAINGKYLNVIVERLHGCTFRVKTAFEMSDNYISSYRRRVIKLGRK